MNTRFLAGILTLTLCASLVAGAEGKLPEPQKSGGKSVLEAIEDRASAPGNAFPSGTISDAELSTILWAATGLNRPRGWTVPMAMGVEPYVKVYVVSADGCFLYDWANNSLVKVADGDIRTKVNPQPFAKAASHFLVFVTDPEPLEKIGRGRDRWDEWFAVAVGSMTQNAYLAADALDIGVRYVATMDTELIRNTLALASGEKLICVLPMGKRR